MTFHKKPFDEGTLTKLELFELYTREWLPVFLSQGNPLWREIHIFDFFAGPGQDSAGIPGSPLRIVRQLREAAASPQYQGWGRVDVQLHFFDDNARNVAMLRKRLQEDSVVPGGVKWQVKKLAFAKAFPACRTVLNRSRAAKLVFIDQFGVKHVDDDRFKELIAFDACDFIFFISSSTLHRFREHPAIKLRIKRPDDYSHVHRAVVDYYRELIPAGRDYFLAPFSIKKGSNIWGVVFGSGHALGIDKFLQVAWKKDTVTGEADFDIHGDWQPDLFGRPTKVDAFHHELEEGIRTNAIRDERDVLQLVFKHGVMRQHCEDVMRRLKRESVIRESFRIPQVDNFDKPRRIVLAGGGTA